MENDKQGRNGPDRRTVAMSPPSHKIMTTQTSTGDRHRTSHIAFAVDVRSLTVCLCSCHFRQTIMSY